MRHNSVFLLEDTAKESNSSVTLHTDKIENSDGEVYILPGLPSYVTYTNQPHLPNPHILTPQLGSSITTINLSIDEISIVSNQHIENEYIHIKQENTLKDFLFSFAQRDSPRFLRKTVEQSWKWWSKLKTVLFTRDAVLSVPDACVDEDSNIIMYSWSYRQYYLECEIDYTGLASFFYRDRTTGHNWSAELTNREKVTEALIKKLAYFITAKTIQ